jgi:hypothetical protein
VGAEPLADVDDSSFQAGLQTENQVARGYLILMLDEVKVHSGREGAVKEVLERRSRLEVLEEAVGQETLSGP